MFSIPIFSQTMQATSNRKTLNFKTAFKQVNVWDGKMHWFLRTMRQLMYLRPGSLKIRLRLLLVLTSWQAPHCYNESTLWQGVPACVPPWSKGLTRTAYLKPMIYLRLGDEQEEARRSPGLWDFVGHSSWQLSRKNPWIIDPKRWVSQFLVAALWIGLCTK